MIRLSFDSAYLVLGPAFDPGPVGPVFLGVLANQYLLEAHLLKQTLSLHLPRFYPVSYTHLTLPTIYSV